MRTVLILSICIAIAFAQNPTILPGTVTHGIGCEHASLSLKCPPGQHLNVFDANYGRTDKTTCFMADVSSITNCFSNQTQYFQDLCNGQNACNHIAENSEFGDPCVGTYKYLGIIVSNIRNSKLLFEILIF